MSMYSTGYLLFDVSAVIGVVFIVGPFVLFPVWNLIDAWRHRKSDALSAATGPLEVPPARRWRPFGRLAARNARIANEREARR